MSTYALVFIIFLDRGSRRVVGFSVVVNDFFQLQKAMLITMLSHNPLIEDVFLYIN